MKIKNSSVAVLYLYTVFVYYFVCACIRIISVFFVFLPARRYASAGYSDRNVSVCLSVPHTPVLCQNEDS